MKNLNRCRTRLSLPIITNRSLNFLIWPDPMRSIDKNLTSLPLSIANLKSSSVMSSCCIVQTSWFFCDIFVQLAGKSFLMANLGVWRGYQLRVKIIKSDSKKWYKSGEEFEVIKILRHRDELSKRTLAWQKETNTKPRIPLDQIVTYRVIKGYDIDFVSASDVEVTDIAPIRKLSVWKYELWESYRFDRRFRVSANSALVILAGVIYWCLK